MKLRNVISGPVLALLLVLSASLGCNMLGSRTSNTKGTGNEPSAKGLAPKDICRLLSDPAFETRAEWNGSGCSGSTFFGARDTRTASYETDNRGSFSFAAIGDEKAVTRVIISMVKRDDEASKQLFLTEAQNIAKLINGQPLPQEIENAITSPLFATGGDFTTTSKVGNAKAELVRSSADSKFYLTFNF